MNNSLLKGDLILYRTTKFWTKPNRKHLKDKKKIYSSNDDFCP